MSTKVQDVSKLKDALIDKAPTCFLCKWILEDLHLHGDLTDHPKNANLEKPLFPVDAKLWHLKLERISLDS